MSRLPRIRLNTLTHFFLGISLLGLVLVAALTFSTQSSEVISPRQRFVVGLVFGLICFLGIIAGVFPSRCSRIFHFQEERGGRLVSREKLDSMRTEYIAFEGHHPDCEDFSAHVFQMGGKKYCAGCTGLVAGAVISLFGTLVFFSTEIVLGNMGVLVFWLGFAGAIVGLLQHSLSRNQGSGVHLLLNTTFVLGAFLLLVGIDEITGDLFLEGYFLVLTLYWILTRMFLSRQEHRRICRACGLESCPHFEKKELASTPLGDAIDGA
ncbi:MAG: hypothetical protein JSW01_06375 [Candidatus Bathyarchaeota archaeon]|nr:MAG: hypothetical protein JSW01_06375 [Candidatus Bathyarchaeota archaeon]